MAFDATTPYALACLNDNARSIQSLTVLRQQESAEVRVKNLVELAQSWDVEMTEEEAEHVVEEFDSVVKAQPKAAGILTGRAAAFSAFS